MRFIKSPDVALHWPTRKSTALAHAMPCMHRPSGLQARHGKRSAPASRRTSPAHSFKIIPPVTNLPPHGFKGPHHGARSCTPKRVRAPWFGLFFRAALALSAAQAADAQKQVWLLRRQSCLFCLAACLCFCRPAVGPEKGPPLAGRQKQGSGGGCTPAVPPPSGPPALARRAQADASPQALKPFPPHVDRMHAMHCHCCAKAKQGKQAD